MGLLKRTNKDGSITYYARMWEGGRERWQALGPAKKEAEAMLAQLQLERRQRKLGITLPTRAKRPFDVYLRHWLDTYARTYCKASTLAGYTTAAERYLIPAFGTTDLGDISREQVKELAYRLLKDHSRSYAKSTLAPLISCLNAAVEDGHLAINPALRVIRQTRSDQAPAEDRVHALTREQLAHLLATCQQHLPAHYPFVLLLARTGLRIGEAVALQWSDLNFHESYVRVRRNWVDGLLDTPKSGKSRRVDMSDQLSVTLKTLRTERKKETLKRGWAEIPPWVIVSESGGILDPDNFRRRAWARLTEKAGLADCRIHDLRHTFASLLIQQGESLTYVRDQLGHSSIKITADTYGHLVPGGNRQAVNRLDDTDSEPHSITLKK